MIYGTEGILSFLSILKLKNIILNINLLKRYWYSYVTFFQVNHQAKFVHMQKVMSTRDKMY